MDTYFLNVQFSFLVVCLHLESEYDQNMPKKKMETTMYPLGSKERPMIVKVSSKERAEKITTICATYDFDYIMGLEFNEDLSGLKKTIKDYK